MATFKTYLKALRLPFLTGSLLPVAAATALAYWLHHAFNPGFFGLNLVGVAGLHLGANLINDYYDAFGSDPLNVNVTPFSGGSRVIQNRELEAETVKTLAYFFLAVGVVCGLALIYAGRHWVAVFGFLGLLAGFCYSASPVQLMSLGLGEIFIFLAFGPLLSLGSYYVQTDKLAPVGAAVGLPLAFLITAIIWINEFPDLEGRPGRGQAPPGLPPGPESVPLGLRRPDAGAVCQPLGPPGILPAARPDHRRPGGAAPGPAGHPPGLAHRAHRPRLRHGPGPHHPDPLLAGPDPDPGLAVCRLGAGIIAVSGQLSAKDISRIFSCSGIDTGFKCSRRL